MPSDTFWTYMLKCFSEEDVESLERLDRIAKEEKLVFLGEIITCFRKATKCLKDESCSCKKIESSLRRAKRIKVTNTIVSKTLYEVDCPL